MGGTAQVGRFGEKTREARLTWLGHVQGKDGGYIGRRMPMTELPGKGRRGRHNSKLMDAVLENMPVVEATEENAEDSKEWRWTISCGES